MRKEEGVDEQRSHIQNRWRTQDRRVYVFAVLCAVPGCDAPLCTLLRGTSGTALEGAGARTDGRLREAWQEDRVEEEVQEEAAAAAKLGLVQRFVWLCRSLVKALGEQLPTLLACDVPGFLPPIVADAIAQGTHRIHMLALPPHPGSFATCVNHQCVRTFRHA